MASSKGAVLHKWISINKPIDVGLHVHHKGPGPPLWVWICSNIEGIAHAIQQAVQFGINCPKQMRGRSAISYPLHPAKSAHHTMHPFNLITLPKENGNDAGHLEDEVSLQQDDAGVPVHLAGNDIVFGSD